MSASIRIAAIAPLVLAAVLMLWAGHPLMSVPALLIALAVAAALLLLARRRPERIALVLAVVVVAGGAIATGVRVAEGIAESRVEYRGELDAGEILHTFQSFGTGDDPASRFERRGAVYLSDAEGVATVPRADGSVVALWSIMELAPWLLAAIVLALLAPILRAAERGDPFWRDATRRLSVIGMLLLGGIPAITVVRYFVADRSFADGASPLPEPSLSLSLSQFLPGLLVLTLAGVFRRGVELRDLERHTI